MRSSPASQLAGSLFSLGALGMGTPTLLCPIPITLICLCPYPILAESIPFSVSVSPIPTSEYVFFRSLLLRFSPYLSTPSLSLCLHLLSQLPSLSLSSHLHPCLCLFLLFVSQSSLFLPLSLSLSPSPSQSLCVSVSCCISISISVSL